MIDTSEYCLPHAGASQRMRVRVAVRHGCGGGLSAVVLSGGSHQWLSSPLEHHAVGPSGGHRSWHCTRQSCGGASSCWRLLCRADSVRLPSSVAIIGAGCHRWLSLLAVVCGSFSLGSCRCRSRCHSSAVLLRQFCRRLLRLCRSSVAVGAAVAAAGGFAAAVVVVSLT